MNKYSIDLIERVEPILLIQVQFFSKKIYIKKKYKSIKIAKKAETYANFTFCCNKFKLNQGPKAAVVWKLDNK